MKPSLPLLLLALALNEAARACVRLASVLRQ